MNGTLSAEQIYADYRDKVFSYIRNKVRIYEDAQDLCEDVFVKVFQKLDTYDEKKSSLSTWIYNITRNTVIDYYRSHHDELEILDDYDYGYEQEEEISEDDLILLAEALRQLDEG